MEKKLSNVKDEKDVVREDSEATGSEDEESIRQLGEVELLCDLCTKWFTTETFAIDENLPFMTNYKFMCNTCVLTDRKMYFRRTPTNLKQVCLTALANLTWRSKTDGKNMFSKDKDIIPFIEAHWKQMTTFKRPQSVTWSNKIVTTMMGEPSVFRFKAQPDTDSKEDPMDYPKFGLLDQDLGKIKPYCQEETIGDPICDYQEPMNLQDYKDEDTLVKFSDLEMTSSLDHVILCTERTNIVGLLDHKLITHELLTPGFRAHAHFKLNFEGISEEEKSAIQDGEMMVGWIQCVSKADVVGKYEDGQVCVYELPNGKPTLDSHKHCTPWFGGETTVLLQEETYDVLCSDRPSANFPLYMPDFNDGDTYNSANRLTTIHRDSTFHTLLIIWNQSTNVARVLRKLVWNMALDINIKDVTLPAEFTIPFEQPKETEYIDLSQFPVTEPLANKSWRKFMIKLGEKKAHTNMAVWAEVEEELDQKEKEMYTNARRAQAQAKAALEGVEEGRRVSAEDIEEKNEESEGTSKWYFKQRDAQLKEETENLAIRATRERQAFEDRMHDEMAAERREARRVKRESKK